jgi:hypothetical protein
MVSSSLPNVTYQYQVEIVEALISLELKINDFFTRLPEIYNPVVQGRLDSWLFNEYQLAHINNYKLREFVARYPFLRKPGTCVYGMKCLSSV